MNRAATSTSERHAGRGAVKRGEVSRGGPPRKYRATPVDRLRPGQIVSFHAPHFHPDRTLPTMVRVQSAVTEVQRVPEGWAIFTEAKVLHLVPTGARVMAE